MICANLSSWIKKSYCFVSDDLQRMFLNANNIFEVKSVNYRELTREHSTFNNYIDLVRFDVFFDCCWAYK